VEYRRIKLGRVIDGLRIVREGLKAETFIVVNGAQRGASGLTVTPQTVTMGADAATVVRRPHRPSPVRLSVR